MVSTNIPQNSLVDILLKSEKSLDDAHLIYERIRNFPFFENFFNQYLKTLDFLEILALCQGCQYEQISIGKSVFRTTEDHTSKLYVIISGQVGVLTPKADDDDGDGSKGKKKLRKKKARLMSTLSEAIQIKPVIGLHRNATLNITLAEELFSPILGSKKPQLRSINSIGGLLSPIPEKGQDNNNKGVFERKNNNSQQRLLTDDSLQIKLKETTTNVINGEEEIIASIHDSAKFEEQAMKFGHEIKILEKGDSFGNLSIKTNANKMTMTICKTDCEFLVMNKAQFDEIFQKKGKEKEAFLKEVFPFLKGVVSSTTLNMILYSFKTEIFSKGQLLTIEGKASQNDPKFYIIHHGECKVEKGFSIMMYSPFDKTKVIATNTEQLKIAVVGKGTLVGEEMLTTGNEYHYTVKAQSENVIAYSITRSDFTSGYLKEFQKTVIETYERKKMQRDVIYENAMKDSDSKLSQFKAENAYSLKNSQMKHLIKKPSIQKLSKYMHREQQSAGGQQDLPLSKLIMLKKVPHIKTSSAIELYIPTEETEKDMNEEMAIKQMITSTKEKRQIVKSVEEVRHPKRQNMEAKMEFLSKGPNKKRMHSEEQKKLEEVKFFYEQDPKKIRILEILKAKISNQIFQTRSSHSPTRNPEQSQTPMSVKPIHSLIKEVTKGSKNFKKKSLELIDVKGGYRSGTPEAYKPDGRSSPESVSPMLRRQISDYTKLQQSPLKSKALFHIRRSTTATPTPTAGSNQYLPKQGFLQTIEGDSPIKMMQFMTEVPQTVSSQVSLSKIKSYNYFDDEEIRNNIREKHQANQANQAGRISILGKTQDYKLKSVPLVDEEENDEAVSIGPFDKSPVSPKSEASFTKLISRSNNSSSTRLTSLITPSNSQLRKTNEWRKKVFQKVPLKDRDAGRMPMESVSLMPSSNPSPTLFK